MAVETFAEELRRSGYLHRPLPLHEETTREARLRRRAVLDAKLSGLRQKHCPPRLGRGGRVG